MDHLLDDDLFDNPKEAAHFAMIQELCGLFTALGSLLLRKGIFTAEEFEAIKKEVDAKVAVDKIFDPEFHAWAEQLRQLKKKRRQIAEGGAEG